MQDLELKKAVELSIEYLNSNEAIESIEADPYWPKWNSPWWHMTLLHEMRLSSLIPKKIALFMAQSIHKHYLKIFPIHPEDTSFHEIEFYRFTACHCALGNIVQALFHAGVDVDQEIPWFRQWFFKYQMQDGGLNCDSEAYLHQPQESSIVGTISPLEAILFCTPREFTIEEKRFLDKGAKNLIDRKCMLSINVVHNKEEKEDEEEWKKLCFPRFYFYDILRGLNFLLHYSLKCSKPIPKSSVEPAFHFLMNRFKHGEIVNERLSYGITKTLLKGSDQKWETKKEATFFPLLSLVSEVGVESPFLTRSFEETLKLFEDLQQKGFLI